MLLGTTENCLFLEAQEPAGPGQRLPVMFEIHGGGFLGEARDGDGTNFVGATRIATRTVEILKRVTRTTGQGCRELPQSHHEASAESFELSA